MNYINLRKKKLVGRNNQPIPPFVSDFDTNTSAAFSFISDDNKILDVPVSAGLYFAGSKRMNTASDMLLWLCKDFSIDGSTLTFSNIDTYTSGYLEEIKKKWTEVNIEIGVYNGQQKEVLLRDTGLANPRVYLEGIAPHPIDMDVYTKEETDTLLSGLSGEILEETDTRYVTPDETEELVLSLSGAIVEALGTAFVPTSEKGVAGGVATLDESGKLLSTQLPPIDLSGKADLVDGKVPSSELPFASLGETPAAVAGEAGIIAFGGNMGFKKISLATGDVVALDLPSDTEIASRTSPYKAITPSKLNAAVTAALTDANHITLTEEQQATAQSVLGIDDVGGDFVPLSSVGIPSGVAELDANGKVPSGQIPFATGETTGGLITRSRYGNALNAQGVLYLVRATDSEINDKNNNQVEAILYKPIVPYNLDYAVRSVLPNLVTIPAGTAAYTLLDASATTNSHACTYKHTPSSVPTYTLPDVTDTTVQHTIVLYVKFTYQTLSYNFQDTSENAIIPLSTPYIEHGKVICFLCEYSSLLSKWVIMPIDMGS